MATPTILMGMRAIRATTQASSPPKGQVKKLADSKIQARLEQLQNRIADLLPGGICLAYSGGVDSTLLLEVAQRQAKKLGGRIEAVTFSTCLHPVGEIEAARKTAQIAGVPFHVLEVDEFTVPEVVNNSVDRCYHCKKMLFATLQDFAKIKGLRHCVEGTNADDLKEYRPGIRALKELGMISPLAELGITKSEVRELAKELGLECHSKPSTPCLATRLPYGVRLDAKLLSQIDQGEMYLRAIGFQTVRIRLHSGVARIEILPEQFTQFLSFSTDIVAKLKDIGFDYITLDLEGFRSGSMDIHVK